MLGPSPVTLGEKETWEAATVWRGPSGLLWVSLWVPGSETRERGPDFCTGEMWPLGDPELEAVGPGEQLAGWRKGAGGATEKKDHQPFPGRR